MSNPNSNFGRKGHKQRLVCVASLLQDVLTSHGAMTIWATGGALGPLDDHDFRASQSTFQDELIVFVRPWKITVFGSIHHNHRAIYSIFAT